MKTIKNFQHAEISTAFAAKVLGGLEVSVPNPTKISASSFNGKIASVSGTLGTKTVTLSECKDDEDISGNVVCEGTEV